MILWRLTDEENMKMHDTLLKQGCTFVAMDGLTGAAKRCFREKGAWLEGLATGKILPLTPEQKQFVGVACGYGEPQTDEEVYWREYQKLLKTPSSPNPRFIGVTTITRGQALTTQQSAEREMNGYRPEAKRPGDSSGIQNWIDSGKDADEFY